MQIHDDYDADGAYYDSPPLCLGVYVYHFSMEEEHEEELGDFAPLN